MTAATRTANSNSRPVVTGCAQSNYTRRIYTAPDWMLMQKAYREALGKESTIDAATEAYGFLIPFEVRDSPEKGRGVYATAPVKEGTKVWKSTKHASFRTEAAFRSFMDKLPYYEWKCEILLWAYASGSGKGAKASVDLDPGSFINHGDSRREINLSSGGYALRNIEAGEQLLMNYSKFIAYDALPWFDEARSLAWKYDDGEDGENRTTTSSTLYRSTTEYNRLGSSPAVASTASVATANTTRNIPERSNGGQEQIPPPSLPQRLDEYVDAMMLPLLVGTMFCLFVCTPVRRLRKGGCRKKARMF